uniref:Uncharacterized protein n=1 Tax=Mimivirus LCMiAC01 TaxID=2506608 RepID=A0A481YZS0_9VIRU|nr:MAG: hypothetical protein LCMiAC01_03860 [Mimivirus LCMiAC01]
MYISGYVRERVFARGTKIRTSKIDQTIVSRLIPPGSVTVLQEYLATKDFKNPGLVAVKYCDKSYQMILTEKAKCRESRIDCSRRLAIEEVGAEIRDDVELIFSAETQCGKATIDMCVVNVDDLDVLKTKKDTLNGGDNKTRKSAMALIGEADAVLKFIQEVKQSCIHEEGITSLVMILLSDAMPLMTLIDSCNKIYSPFQGTRIAVRVCELKLNNPKLLFQGKEIDLWSRWNKSKSPLQGKKVNQSSKWVSPFQGKKVTQSSKWVSPFGKRVPWGQCISEQRFCS